MDCRCQHTLDRLSSFRGRGTARVCVRGGGGRRSGGWGRAEAQAARGSGLRDARERSRLDTCNWFYLECLLLCVTSYRIILVFETVCLVWLFGHFSLLSPASLSECASRVYLSLHPLSLCSCYFTKRNVCVVIVLKDLVFHCPIQEPLVAWGCLNLGLN